jgi:hypothetical protein
LMTPVVTPVPRSTGGAIVPTVRRWGSRFKSAPLMGRNGAGIASACASVAASSDAATASQDAFAVGGSGKVHTVTEAR